MTYTPLCPHKDLDWIACPECEHCKLMMRLSEADEDFAALAEWRARLDAHLAGEHAAEMEMYP